MINCIPQSLFQLINKAYTTPAAPLTEDEKWDKQQKFTEKNKKIIEKYGMLQKYEDSQEFLKEHIDLVCEETTNYLVIWCINLECEEVSNFWYFSAYMITYREYIVWSYTEHAEVLIYILYTTGT